MPERLALPARVVDIVSEIQRLVFEMYDHYIERAGYGWKSSEGALTIELGTYFDRAEDGSMPSPSISIYSYIFDLSGRGGRTHYFDNPRVALAAVREAHAREMRTATCPTCESDIEAGTECRWCLDG